MNNQKKQKNCQLKISQNQKMLKMIYHKYHQKKLNKIKFNLKKMLKEFKIKMVLYKRFAREVIYQILKLELNVSNFNVRSILLI